MGQSTLLIVFAATATILVLLFAIGRNMRDSDEELSDYHYRVFAREAAATGLNMTVRKLAADPDNWQSNPSSYEYPSTPYRSGSFSTKVTPVHPAGSHPGYGPCDSVYVVAEGVDGTTRHRIEAKYGKEIASLVPPALRYGTYAGVSLTLNGDASISSVYDTAYAHVHTNGVLTVDDSSVSVDGFGTYGPGESYSTPGDPDDIFSPDPDPNGSDPNVFEGDEVDAPDLVANDFLDDATYVTFSDTTLSGEIDFSDWVPGFGTKANPFLLFVNGDLTISSTTFYGYARVVSTGAITILDDATATLTAPPGTPDEAEWNDWAKLNLDEDGHTKVAWYAAGEIVISGGSNVVGQLYSKQNVTFAGGGLETNVVGGVTSVNGAQSIGGGVNIRFARMSKSALLPGWEHVIPAGLVLIAYAEW